MTGRGRPSAAKSKEISERILNSASKIFQERGYEGTSMEAIASDADVGKQAIYKRYPSKDDLFVRTYNYTISRLSHAIGERIGTSETAAGRLKSACQAMTISMLDPSMVNLTRIAMAEANRFPMLSNLVREGSIAEFVTPLAEHVAELQKEGKLPDGDPVIFSHSILVGCYCYPLLGALLGHNPLEKVADREAYFDKTWPMVTMGRLG